MNVLLWCQIIGKLGFIQLFFPSQFPVINLRGTEPSFDQPRPLIPSLLPEPCLVSAAFIPLTRIQLLV